MNIDPSRWFVQVVRWAAVCLLVAFGLICLNAALAQWWLSSGPPNVAEPELHRQWGNRMFGLAIGLALAALIVAWRFRRARGATWVSTHDKD